MAVLGESKGGDVGPGSPPGAVASLPWGGGDMTDTAVVVDEVRETAETPRSNTGGVVTDGEAVFFFFLMPSEA